MKKTDVSAAVLSFHRFSLTRPAFDYVWFFFSALQSARVEMKKMARTSSPRSKSSRACLRREFLPALFLHPMRMLTENLHSYACPYVCVALAWTPHALCTYLVTRSTAYLKIHFYGAVAIVRGCRPSLGESAFISRTRFWYKCNILFFTAGYISSVCVCVCVCVCVFVCVCVCTYTCL